MYIKQTEETEEIHYTCWHNHTSIRILLKFQAPFVCYNKQQQQKQHW